MDATRVSGTEGSHDLLDISCDLEIVINAARTAAESAYCPYSHFRVGAAVLTEDGNIYTGCNIENAGYGMTICAERVAIFKAVSEHHNAINAIVVSCLDGDPSQPETLMPCGACRQVMAEFMDDDSLVIIDRVQTFPFKDIMPMAFRLPAFRKP